MIFSLINVSTISKEGKVVGYWIQDHIGTLESAKQCALETEQANSNRITVVVTNQVNSSVPALNFWSNLQRL